MYLQIIGFLLLVGNLISVPKQNLEDKYPNIMSVELYRWIHYLLAIKRCRFTVEKLKQIIPLFNATLLIIYLIHIVQSIKYITYYIVINSIF